MTHKQWLIHKKIEKIAPDIRQQLEIELSRSSRPLGLSIIIRLPREFRPYGSIADMLDIPYIIVTNNGGGQYYYTTWPDRLPTRKGYTPPKPRLLP